MHNRRLFLAVENGLVDLLELVVLFLLRSRGELSVLKTGKRFPWMLYLTLLRFFSKREGKIHSTFDKQMFVHLARMQHKVVLLALQ